MRAVARAGGDVQVRDPVRHGPHAALVDHEDEPLVDHHVALMLDGLQLKLGALQLGLDGQSQQYLYRRVHQQIKYFPTGLHSKVTTTFFARDPYLVLVVGPAELHRHAFLLVVISAF